jgi:hypothetical protein
MSVAPIPDVFYATEFTACPSCSAPTTKSLNNLGLNCPNPDCKVRNNEPNIDDEGKGDVD